MSERILRQMRWRRALKQFQPSSKTLDISSILKAACLAPTSFGIQPFQVYVVTNSELKERIAAAAYDQPQITSCSHLMIFAARSDASNTVERCISAHKFDTVASDYAKLLRESLSAMDSASFLNWSSNQAHIALGFSLVAAADLQIGSCPMGGFDAEALGKVINLPSNEKVVVLLSLGIAPLDGDNDIKANPFPKYNMLVDELVTTLGKGAL